LSFASFIDVIVLNVDSSYPSNVMLGIELWVCVYILLYSSVVLLSSVLDKLYEVSINSFGNPASNFILFKHFLIGFFLFFISDLTFLIIIQASMQSFFLFSSSYSSS